MDAEVDAVQGPRPGAGILVANALEADRVVGHGRDTRLVAAAMTSAIDPRPKTQRAMRWAPLSGSSRMIVRRPLAENARASSASVRSSMSPTAPRTTGPA